jgi:hypothetical protein
MVDRPTTLSRLQSSRDDHFDADESFALTRWSRGGYVSPVKNSDRLGDRELHDDLDEDGALPFPVQEERGEWSEIDLNLRVLNLAAWVDEVEGVGANHEAASAV